MLRSANLKECFSSFSGRESSPTHLTLHEAFLFFKCSGSCDKVFLQNGTLESRGWSSDDSSDDLCLQYGSRPLISMFVCRRRFLRMASETQIWYSVCCCNLTITVHFQTQHFYFYCFVSSTQHVFFQCPHTHSEHHKEGKLFYLAGNSSL